MKNILFILLFTPFIVSSQNINYTGKYICHEYGEEEGSETLILIDTDYPIAYITSWLSEDGDPDGSWHENYEYLTNIRITDKFYSSKYNGTFVMTQQDTYILMINCPYNDTCIYYLTGNAINYMPIVSTYKFDRYTLSSLVEVEGLDLKIMRNGIFARHGYIFIKDGEMDKYFKSKEWYNARFNNITHLLSDTERHNIKLIKQLEK